MKTVESTHEVLVNTQDGKAPPETREREETVTKDENGAGRVEQEGEPRQIVSDGR